MRKTKLLTIALLSMALAVVGSAGAIAQPDPTGPAYFTASLGERAAFIPPAEEFLVEGGRQMRGLGHVDIDFDASDPRIAGKLTIFANGAGVDLADGISNVESRTYRIVNDEGAWTGSGVAAFADIDDILLFDTEVLLLTGAGGHIGLSAFVSMNAVDEQIEGVIYTVELPPPPDAVPLD